MRYFELGLGNSVEENWEDFETTICIQGLREPKDFNEAYELVKNEYKVEHYNYKVVSITEISEAEAREYYNIDNIKNLITVK